MATLPVGCKLSDRQLATVAAVYARAAEHYQAAVRYERDRALIDLHGPKDELVRLTDEMIEREGSCCSHLRFDVAETGQGYSIVLSVEGSPGQELEKLRQAVPVLFPAATSVSSTGRIAANSDSRR